MHTQQTLEPQTGFYRDVLEHIDDGIYFVDLERRIAYWNKGAEKISGYRAFEVIGSHCSDNILMHVDNTGRSLCLNGCPLTATMMDGIPRKAEVYLHHKNGHRIPIHVRVSALHDEHGKIIGGVETFSDSTSRIAALDRIKELESVAYVDLLTGIANRRYTQVMLEARFTEKDRYNWQFGLIMCDVDHFKEFNDLHGHETGDRVLQMVARTLNHNIRSFDLVGRWGGEEFMVIVANVDQSKLGKMSENLRALVEQSSLTTGDKPLRVTVSVGATTAHSDDNAETLINRADELMYQSKAAGRNRVSLG